MPRTRSIAWSEIKLGVVGSIALALAGMLLLAVTGDTGLPWQRYSVKVRFDSVKGLEEGAMVRLNGKDVGRVRTLEFADDKIDVVLNLTKDVRPMITTNSVASIGSMGMLGDAAVDLTISKRGTPIEEWGYVKPAPGASGGDLSTLVTDIRSGKGTLGKLMTDRELYENLNHAAAEMRGLMADIRKDPKKFLQMTFRIF
jgi:phospholipid/cholesterol/gamma-HCH transport system substrate-binding protein